MIPTVNVNVKLTKILSKQGKLWISWTKVSKICLVLLWLLLLLFNLLFLVISHFTLSQCYVVLHFMVIFLIHEFFWGNVSHDSYLMHEEWMIKLCKKNPLNRTTPCIDFKEAKKSPTLKMPKMAEMPNIFGWPWIFWLILLRKNLISFWFFFWNFFGQNI